MYRVNWISGQMKDKVVTLQANILRVHDNADIIVLLILGTNDTSIV